MNLSRAGYYDAYPVASVQSNAGLSSARRQSDDSGGDDVSAARESDRPHRHAGGQVGDAVMEALQSLGLNLPPPQTDATTSGTATTTTTTDTSSTTSSTTTSTSSDDTSPIDLRKDMGNLMHALFEAVKGESGGTGTTTGTDTSTGSGVTSGQNSFSSGLSALITQAANGTAPDDLTSAFKALATDLQTLAGDGDSADTTTDTTTSDATTGATADDPASSLQAFLAKLQDSLGYGGLSGSGSTSSLLDSHA